MKFKIENLTKNAEHMLRVYYPWPSLVHWKEAGRQSPPSITLSACFSIVGLIWGFAKLEEVAQLF